MANDFDVIYLTGAPAVGKSSLAEQLKQVISPLEVFNYGDMLTKHLSTKFGKSLTQENIRNESSAIVAPEDVSALDSLLVQRVREIRSTSSVVIDTHAVTKEAYGFRVTPFSLQRFGELCPTKIVVLYTSPEITISRIAANPGGRPVVSAFESQFHSVLQGSVALCYGTSLGIPVYFLEADKDPRELVDWFRCHCGK